MNRRTPIDGRSPGHHPAKLAALVAVILAILAISGCRITPTPSSTTSQGSTVITSEFSTLDAAGVEQIKTDGRARLDMSSGSLQKSAVRVADSSYGPEINTQGSGKIQLSIVGPSGEVTGQTDRIRFKTTDARADFSEVTYFLTAESAEDLFAQIREGVEKYGIDPEDAERWISSAGKDSTGTSDYSLTSGTSTGLSVNYDIRFDASKDTQVIIVHVSPTA